MHIHDFYAKLTSATEESRLFHALRILSRIEDPKSITDDAGTFGADWGPSWPGLGAGTLVASAV
ncbi:MAG TPA: hypothetical protein VIJ36_01570 [Thermoanaerobaculia bacterium]|jgi:hypothetical protein